MIQLIFKLAKTGLLILFGITTALGQVWPGDINDNGTVNSVDVLYWSLANLSAGPARTESSLVWQEHPLPTLWDEEFADGANFAYADCNGDGFVDLVDQFVVSINQDSMQGPYLGENFSTGTHSIDPPIWLGEAMNETLSVALEQTTINIPINLGTVDLPVENFYGIAFNLFIDTTFLGDQFTAIVEQPTDAWLYEEAGYVVLNVDSAFQKEGFLGFDLAHYLLEPEPVSGNGKIANLKLVIEDDLTLLHGDTSIQFIVEPIRVIDQNLNNQNITGDSLEVMIFKDSISMLPINDAADEAAKMRPTVSPNPCLNRTRLDLQEGNIGSYVLYTMTGQPLKRAQFDLPVAEAWIDLQHLPPAVYILVISNQNGHKTRINITKQSPD